MAVRFEPKILYKLSKPLVTNPLSVPSCILFFHHADSTYLYIGPANGLISLETGIKEHLPCYMEPYLRDCGPMAMMMWDKHSHNQWESVALYFKFL